MTIGDELDLLASDCAEQLGNASIVLQLRTMAPATRATGRDNVLGVRSYELAAVGFARTPIDFRPGKDGFESAVFDVTAAAIAGAGGGTVDGSPSTRTAPQRGDVVLQAGQGPGGAGGADVVWMVARVSDQVGGRVFRLTCERKRNG